MAPSSSAPEGWVAALGKTAVVCEDSPNFIVNRICRPLYYEAQLLATQGVAPATVDAVARGGLAHRMGPLELLDFAGLHTHLGSSETALREFGDPRYRPIPRTRALVRAGATGPGGWARVVRLRERPACRRARCDRHDAGAHRHRGRDRRAGPRAAPSQRERAERDEGER